MVEMKAGLSLGVLSVEADIPVNKLFQGIANLFNNNRDVDKLICQKKVTLVNQFKPNGEYTSQCDMEIVIKSDLNVIYQYNGEFVKFSEDIRNYCLDVDFYKVSMNKRAIIHMLSRSALTNQGDISSESKNAYGFIAYFNDTLAKGDSVSYSYKQSYLYKKNNPIFLRKKLELSKSYRFLRETEFFERIIKFPLTKYEHIQPKYCLLGEDNSIISHEIEFIKECQDNEVVWRFIIKNPPIKSIFKIFWIG